MAVGWAAAAKMKTCPFRPRPTFASTRRRFRVGAIGIQDSRSFWCLYVVDSLAALVTQALGGLIELKSARCSEHFAPFD